MAKARPFIIASAVLFVLLILILQIRESEAPQPMEPETYSVSSDGWKALYLTLQQSGFKVSRWERPLSDFEAPGTILVVAGPLEPVTGKEATAVYRWVEEGGTLVVFSGATAGLFDADGFLGEEALLEKFHVSTDTLAQYSREGVGLKAERIRVETKGSAPPEFALEAPKPARLFVPGSAARLLAGPDGSTVGTRIAAGKGAAYVFSSYDFLSNGWIDRADNFAYFYRLFSGLGFTVAFDEFHHGHRAADLRAGQKRVTPFWGLQVLLFATLYFYAEGRRFGRIRFLPERERYRSPLEHVDAVANLYQKSNVNLEVLEDYYRYYREILYRRLGIPPKGGGVEAARGTTAWPVVQQIEGEYARLGARKPLRADALTAFARRIEKLKEALSS